MASRTTADLYAPTKPPVAGTVAVGVLITIITGALAAILSSPVIVVLTVVLCLVLTAGIAVMMHRSWQRRQMMPAMLLAAWSEVLRMQLRAPMLKMRRFERGSLLRTGPPRRISLQDPMKRELPRREMEEAAAMTLGAPYKLDPQRSKPTKRVVFELAYPEAEKEVTPREEVAQRVTKSAREFLGPEAKVTAEWDETQENQDYLTSLEITNFNGADLALSGKRNQIVARLRTRLPQGNFAVDVDPQQDLVRFSRAKPLPALVLPPARHAPQVRCHADYRALQIPLGIAAGGGVAMWHLRKLPHYLAIGGTGGGKTICEHGVIQALTQAACRVWLIDGKGIEFIGYNEWPNVEFLAQDVESQVRLIYLAHETMQHRYQLIREGKATLEDMDEIILMIDELTSFKAIADQLYRRTKEKKAPAQSELMEWIGNLLRLARSSKIHLFVGMQRPDTRIIDGEARDNMGGRISLGPLNSKDGSLMMWDNAAIGVQIPRIPGRAVGLVDSVPTQIQATYNANPDPKADDYHAGMIAAARPKVTVFTRKYVGTPEVDFDEDTGTELPVTWSQVIAAPIVDASGKTIELDPVMTEEARQARQAPVELDERPYELQIASGMEDIDRLFDPVATMHFGGKTLRALRTLFPAHHRTENSPLAVPEGMAGSLQESLGSGSSNYVLCRIDELTIGDRVLLEEEPVMLSTIEPLEDDPEQFLLEGYTDDGTFVSRVMEGLEEVSAVSNDAVEEIMN